MGFNATKSAGSFEPVPQGQYVARCYRMIDLGTQENEWQGEKYTSHKIMIWWELLRNSDGDRPLVGDTDKVHTMLKE